MYVDPRRLELLLAVARNGGILAAADALRLTASAVSQQIRKLERETGSALLERTPAGAVLTPAGRVLAETAERIEHELRKATQELLELGDSVTGWVTVGAYKSVIRGLLLPLLPQLPALAPGISLRLLEVSPEEGKRLLRQGRLDIAILESDTGQVQSAPRGTAEPPLLEEPWLFVYPDSLPTPRDGADLVNYQWLSSAPDTASWLATSRLAGRYGFTPLTDYIYYDYDVALGMVAGELGVTVLPRLGVVNVPPGVRTARLPGLGTRRLVMRHRSTRTEPSPPTIAVCKLLRAQAGSLTHSEAG